MSLIDWGRMVFTVSQFQFLLVRASAGDVGDVHFGFLTKLSAGRIDATAVSGPPAPTGKLPRVPACT